MGLGIDVVEITRIEKAMLNPRFLLRILTERERAECKTAERVAGRWAAKEAVAKALGGPLTWHDVEISNDSRGGPFATVTRKPGQRIMISITHEKSIAAAVAVLEG